MLDTGWQQKYVSENQLGANALGGRQLRTYEGRPEMHRAKLRGMIGVLGRHAREATKVADQLAGR